MNTVKLSKLFKGNHYNVNNDFSFDIVKQENYHINGIEHVKNICTKKITFWTVNNQPHHELDVPSFEFSDGIAVIYCKNGKIHRLNGAAFKSDYVKRYYIHNKELTKEEFERTRKINNF